MLCPDIPAERIIRNRLIKFVKDSLNSKNECVSFCATFVIRGCRSHVSKTINFICSRYNVDQYDFQNTSCSDLINDVREYFKTLPGYAIATGAIHHIMRIR